MKQPMIYIHIQNTTAKMKEDEPNNTIIEGKDKPIRPVEV